MTPAQLQQFLKKHSLTIQGLAEILGVTKSAVTHWTKGVRSMPVPIQRILKTFDTYPKLMDEF